MEKRSGIEYILELMRPLNNVSDRLTECVISWLNSEINNPNHINYINDIFMVLDRSNLEADKKAEILRCISEYNEQFYKSELTKRDNYKKLEAKYKISNSSSIILSTKKDESIILEETKPIKSGNIISDTVNYYYHQINASRYDLSKVADILNNIEGNINELICKSIALELNKEINQMYSLLNDKDASYSKEELEEFKDELLLYNELYSFVSNYSYTSNDETHVMTPKYKLIFPKLNNDNNIILSTFKKNIHPEYYMSFLNLINSIEQGRPINLRKFNNHELFNGLMETKGWQSRIIFDHFDKNAYAIVTVFIKKCYWDSKITKMLESAISSYSSYKENMRDSLINEETRNIFYQEQTMACNEIKTYLKNSARRMQ
jgi:hypothetical protein